ncbi:hypothetical protein [Pararhodobacter sp. CCB-MM2]|nr:hypothetical protein [Pararhodobacter sp. CCB-MM2]
MVLPDVFIDQASSALYEVAGLTAKDIDTKVLRLFGAVQIR